MTSADAKLSRSFRQIHVIPDGVLAQYGACLAWFGFEAF